ncbi:hypothetical protein EMCRGX_G014342 [Ephydatia muelleri]|eukprot:Em0001g2889a
MAAQAVHVARFQPYSTTTTPIRGNLASSSHNDDASSSGSARITASIPVPQHPLSGTLKTILDTVQSFQQTLERIETEQRDLKKAFDDSMRDSFSINSSPFKDDLLVKTANLFCNTLSRQPENKDVLEVIGKVLKAEVRIKYKLKAATSFCNARLGELRAEERRRIFAHKPCEAYAKMKSDEFVTRFLPLLKAEKENIPMYHYYVSLLRKYCREEPSSKSKTYKGFAQWLGTKYNCGKPTLAELQQVFQEEGTLFSDHAEELLYLASPTYPEGCS